MFPAEQQKVEVKRMLEEIYNEHYIKYSDDLGRAALKDLQQTHPYHWLYVAELLQNAIDAKAKRIRLKIEDDGSELLLEHDGELFSQKDVKALCSRGMSTKGAATVGFMGIGFKAVFHSFQRVEISSGPWRFYLEVPVKVGDRFGDRQRDWLGCVLPKYSSDIEPPSEGMTCRFVLKKRLENLVPICEDILKVFSKDYMLLPILARFGLKELEWDERKWVLAQTETTSTVDQVSRILLEALDEESERVYQWILFSTRYRPSREAVARFLEHRQLIPDIEEQEKVYSEAESERKVEIFCPIDRNGYPLPPRRGRAYALLPTNTEFPFGLHIQADWLLVTNRQDLMGEDNLWHYEILMQVPILLKAYLEWICTLKKVPTDQLSKFYSILPDLSESNDRNGSWFSNFLSKLKEILRKAKFLPVCTQEGIYFISPENAYVLPEALRKFDDQQYLPWELFGTRIVSTTLLGDRAFKCLDELDLLPELPPEELVNVWKDGAVERWKKALDDQGDQALLSLLECLSDLDRFEAWRNAPLYCLPSEAGNWIYRDIAKRLPPDWGIVPAEDPPIKNWLKPFLPPKEQTLSWQFDLRLQRNFNAEQYVREIPQLKLEDLVSEWWNSLPDIPSSEEVKYVLDFTTWILTKQRQRAALVQKVLCDDKNKRLLLPWNKCALADPYASKSRRRFFAGYYFVSKIYLRHTSSASDADWRSFFESASKQQMLGSFIFREQINKLTKKELISKVRKWIPYYNPPEIRSTWDVKTWRGCEFYSHMEYLLIDILLPEELEKVLATEVTSEIAEDIAYWLHENVQKLHPNNSRKYIRYVPYGSGKLSKEELEVPASWVCSLTEKSWVYAKDGSGPYPPTAVLQKFDEARPESPVADLPEGLIEALIECGVHFGRDIADVSALERLRRVNPDTNIERLREFLKEAVAEAEEDEEKCRQLKDLLITKPLFPVPSEFFTIDRTTSITLNRIVKKTYGTDFGRWLVPLNSLSQDAPITELVELVSDIYEVPDFPTAEQALAFLKWVWDKEPKAEDVRGALPIAYRIIKEELKNKELFHNTWEEERNKAKVFTTLRKWVLINSGNVYFDNLREKRGILRLLEDIKLATPGHLGEKFEEQQKTAELLRLPPLSSRFEVKLIPCEEQATPKPWNANFQRILEYIWYRTQQYTENVKAPPHFNSLSLYKCTTLKKIIFENGIRKNEWDVYAAYSNGKIFIVGDDPIDFMDELCEVLLQVQGLSGHRDLESLAPEPSKLIALLGNSDKFKNCIVKLCNKYGLKIELTEEKFLVNPFAKEKSAEISSHSKKTILGTADRVPNTEQVVEVGIDADKAEDSYVSKAEDNSSTLTKQEISAAKSSQENLISEIDEEYDSIEKTKKAGSTGGSYTAGIREAKLDSLRKKKSDELIAVGISPNVSSTSSSEQSDYNFRKAVIDYEEKYGRFPVLKSATQPGHDIDSFTHPEGHPERKLIRRIEVKGRSYKWNGAETVELSKRQFLEALNRKCEKDIPLAENFDYWLYVVEVNSDGSYQILCIRNPAQRAVKYELRGKTWRPLAES